MSINPFAKEKSVFIEHAKTSKRSFLVSKKATLPFAVIVTAIIAIAVLALILIFMFPTLSKLFTRTSGIQEATSDDVSAAKLECQKLCLEAQGEALSGSSDIAGDWNNTRFCKSKVTKGSLSVTSCYADPIFAKCSATFTDAAGDTIECTASTAGCSCS